METTSLEISMTLDIGISDYNSSTANQINREI